MTEVLLQVPWLLHEIRVQIQERDGDPAQLNLEEATELLRLARPRVPGDYFLRQCTVEVGGRSYSFDEVLLEPYRREVLHQTEPMSYPGHPTRFDWMANMRTFSRDTAAAARWRQPFLWRGSEFNLSSLPVSNPEPIQMTSFRRWRVDVEIEVTSPDTRLEVDPATTAGEIVAVEVEQAPYGRYRVVMDVLAPNVCSLDTETRSYQELGLRVLSGEETRTLQVPVDYLCLLGDHPGFPTIPEGRGSEAIFSDFAGNLARSSQPETSALARQIREAITSRGAAMTLENVLSELHARLSARGAAYRVDPPVSPFGRSEEFFQGWSRPVRDFSPHDMEQYYSYTLQPDETLLYGGDCEDWATFAVALLSRLGFQAQVQLGPMHAWAEVNRAGEVSQVDLTSSSEGFWDCSPLRFPEEAGGTPASACGAED